MSVSAAILPGDRLHLQHGPIDLVIGADGERTAAFDTARAALEGLLESLVEELAVLRQAGWSELGSNNPTVRGVVARRMVRAVARHSGFVTPMAAVAGAVADHVLLAMTDAADLQRAYVNNGGDIAVHLADNARFRLAMSGLQGNGLGAIEISAELGISGVATSGRGGRSLSMGIADSVTVLAVDAASADVAATLIANAVDLPAHPSVERTPANELIPDSDLGGRLVTTRVGNLSKNEVQNALERGAHVAGEMQTKGLIASAALFLQGQARVVGLPMGIETREAEFA